MDALHPDSSYDRADVPIIVRGEGAYVYDAKGKPLPRRARRAVRQPARPRPHRARGGRRRSRPRELAFFPLWSYAHPTAIELAERIAGYAPGDLNRVFFTTGGGEAVETAWKLAKNYFKLTGKPMKHKVISRAIAYHGTTAGRAVHHRPAGAEGGLRAAGARRRSGCRTPTSTARRSTRDDLEAFGRWAADQIAVAIENEGPETVAAVFLEPVQNAGGCFPPPPGYFQRVREICDEYDVLLVSDEVICAFGRLGHMFGAERYGYQPDMITFAKGITSGYSPLGGMIATDRLMEPFLKGTEHVPARLHLRRPPGVHRGRRWPTSTSFENEGINKHVLANEDAFRATLEKLKDLPIVGDVRGDGYFYGIELVKDKATKETFDDAESERLLRGFLSKALFASGLYCRADDRGDPVVQLSPPLICDQQHFDEIEQKLRSVLEEAWTRL